MVYRKAKETLTAVELDRGETLEFELLNGEVRTLTLEETSGGILLTNLDQYGERHSLGRTMYHFTCRIRVDGQPMTMERYVSSQETFYEPYVVNGLRIWFDGVQDIFGFLKETHGACRPAKQARFALQDATIDICPQKVLAWCPIENHFIDVGDSYNGDDPWMGAYLGFDAHGGMDINHPAETPIWAPVDLDDNYYFNSVAMGHNNNRWRAHRTWPDGSFWTLQTHHMTRLTVPEHTPIQAGAKVADGAGVLSGSHDHSHFCFKVAESADVSGLGPADTVEVQVEFTGEDADHYLAESEGRRIAIPKRFLFLRQRDDRPGIPSIFMMSKAQATELGLPMRVHDVLLDPWILFWQAFENEKGEAGGIRAGMAPLSPARAGQPIHFRPSGSRAGRGGGALRYAWTFGDGGCAWTAEPAHVYARPGVYPVTLVVDDGAARASFTQHITVSGESSGSPSLALRADELSFRPRPVQAMDVYGWPVAGLPHTLRFTARPSRPAPGAKMVELANLGGGQLAHAATPRLAYQQGQGWLRVVPVGEQRLAVSVDAAGLAAGTYEAAVEVDCPGALNAPQAFLVELVVPAEPPQPGGIVDDRDPGFGYTPFFWVGHRFYRWERPGYGGFYLVNGKRAAAGEFARFTPDLQAGRYEVRLHEQSPFDPDSRFQVRVRHAAGESIVWMEPSQSRQIGVFSFAEGTDGFVEILAEGSSGQVVADAIAFIPCG